MLHPNTYLFILAACVGVFSGTIKALALSVLTIAVGFAIYRVILDIGNFRRMRETSDEVRVAAIGAGLPDTNELQRRFAEVPKVMLFVAHLLRSLVFAAVTAAVVFGIRYLVG